MQQTGGRRRIDHVLAEDFLADLTSIDAVELQAGEGFELVPPVTLEDFVQAMRRED